MSEPFDAFVSYRRSDGAVAAQRIRRLLQDYRPPKSLRDPTRRKLRVYIDTTYERATDDFFEQVTLPALLSSNHLIVVATPDAADRGLGKVDWVGREIDEFAAGPNARNVAVTRAKGKDGDPLPGRLAQIYPNAEIIDLRGLGPLAFLNPYKSARLADETVKLIASLFGFGPEDMPALRREEERRQQLKLGVTAGVGAAVLASVVALSVTAFTSRNRAIEALTHSAFSSERVIEAVSGSMEKGETRSQLLMTGCDLLDSLASQSGREPSSGPLVKCVAERATYLDTLAAHDEAERRINSVRTKVAHRFEAGAEPDDGLALMEISALALDRTLDRPGATAPGELIAAFDASARLVAERLPEEVLPRRVAAEALQTAAVRMGEKDAVEPAAIAAQGSAVMWGAAFKIGKEPEYALEQAVAEGLAATFLMKLGRQDPAQAARRRAVAIIDEISKIQANADRLKGRIASVNELLDGVAKSGAGR